MSSDATLPGIPETLWRAVAAAPRRLLALDYDGTLAPFQVDPGAARPLPAARRALDPLLAGPTEVVVLSGRPPADVVRLLGAPSLDVVGEHGWTVRRADGGELRHPVPPERIARLDRAQSAATALGRGRLERKRASLVVHTRGLAPGTAGEVDRRARELFAPLAGDGLELRPIDGGLELRVTGRDKGVALAELAAESGPDTLVVAVGDDETDEDAFRAAARLGGWGIRVGAPRPTAARATLASPREVARFLERWAACVAGSGAPSTARAAGSR